MNNKNLRIIITMAILSIAGIVVLQSIWFKKAFDLKEKQFNHNVFIALQNTGEELLKYKKLHVPLESMVYQVSNNYYVVNINCEIETNILEFLLKKELEKRNLLIDFEYGVYNCQTQRVVYGNYVSFKKVHALNKKRELPVWQNDKYYFGVVFPDKSTDLIMQMDIWFFLSLVLLVVCIFFGYTTVVILKQKRLSEIQKDFINNMTHQFKTPISTIQISTELLKKHEVINDSTLTATYISIIQNETLRLKNDVDRVLQMAIFDKAKIKLDFDTIDIQQVIDDTVKNAELLLVSKNGRVSTEYKAQHTMIKGDRYHLSNMIFNLLENAIKYSSEAPQIDISMTNNHRLLMITIKDHGIGIAKEEISKIFDRFYRVSTGNVHNVKGFGLGLFYVREIVKLHNGKIKVKSMPDQGSEFTIHLQTK